VRSHPGVERSGESDAKARTEAVAAYLGEQLGTGRYPHLEALVGDDPASALGRIGQHAADEKRFELGLQCLLDGLEKWIETRR
jgi:hypothetical protein